jgi:4,5-DOPA dioxygenase extradiol
MHAHIGGASDLIKIMDTNTAPKTLPSLFVSHGSPMMALEPGVAGEFLKRLGPAIDRIFGRPRAILVISAHTSARESVLLAAKRHDTVHDFGGFPEALYKLRYDAPGDPALASEVAGLLEAGGFPVHVLDRGGLDHGIWTALRYMYPNADVPVLPLSLVPNELPARQFTTGELLAPLSSKGVLVMSTGSMTHNLRLLGRGRRPDGSEPPEMPESAAFRAWFAENSAKRDWATLFDYRRSAPHAVAMHPTDEHLLPWFVAAGAGGRDVTPLRLYAGAVMGALGMDTYGFGPSAAKLASALVE